MASFSDMTVREFIEQAASGQPTPGGGGVAALVAALGGAMAAMAANFTIGKPRFAQYEQMMRDILGKFDRLIVGFRDAIDADATAFGGISEAYSLPKDTDEAKAVRKEAIARALTSSMEVPLKLLHECAKAAEMLPTLAGASNPNLLSDVEVAGIMLDAAAKAALTNVFVNSRQLRSERARVAEREAVEVAKLVAATTSEVADIIARRSGAV